MSPTAVFAAVAIAVVALVVASQAQQPGPSSGMLLRAMADLARCRMTTGVSEAELRQMFQARQVPTSRPGKCLLACMAETYGVMEGGRFRPDNTLRLVDRLMASAPTSAQSAGRRALVQQVVYTCDSQVGGGGGGDACETAAALAECGMRYAPRRG
ncbi:hypothetical protein ONE63_003227 [Megalurothrips usitatus]|uniref:Uncharacterized protein n=1 Tax=Megalurothrips usitatus TaxID=439358 RepID=A0AAV7XB26_9NEOP|nr:hypothetical protein ONE63_003227 [Megalurothrips usitatus]